MLLPLIFVLQSILISANPFHKYPYVFLLDIGNEELENTFSEQIRVSIPGGSLALRYPAIGNGDTITHLRVSGIDFGTDLKANVLDGGPGYQYVVLVFAGNPGVPYDAVITVQTLPNASLDDISDSQNVSDNSDVSTVDDNNDSAEDLSDKPTGQTSSEITNAQLVQSSSNVYNAVQSVVEEDEDDGGSQSESEQSAAKNEVQIEDTEDYNDDKDIHKIYPIKPEIYEPKDTAKDYVEDERVNQYEDAKSEEQNSGYLNDEQDKPSGVVDGSVYEKFKALRPYFYRNMNVYQGVLPNQKQDTSNDLGPTFDDGHGEIDANRYRDNTNYDTNDNFAVAY